MSSARNIFAAARAGLLSVVSLATAEDHVAPSRNPQADRHVRRPLSRPMHIRCGLIVPVVLAALTLTSVDVSLGFATEATFKVHCAKCHGRVGTLARSLKGDTRNERAAGLSKFLEGHHIDDPVARAAIVEYLVEQTAP